jgi:histidinol dehydrogenase
VISEDHEAILQDLDAVGMVAIGDMSPVALGDYAAGPLPRPPHRRRRHLGLPLGTHDFTARTNYIHFTQEALASLGPHVQRLARLEGFENHAKSVGVRLGKGA